MLLQYNQQNVTEAIEYPSEKQENNFLNQVFSSYFYCNNSILGHLFITTYTPLSAAMRAASPS